MTIFKIIFNLNCVNFVSFYRFVKLCNEHLTSLLLARPNVLSQNEHLKGFSPVWICSCFFTSLGWINLLSQKLHLNGLWLVWEAYSCLFKCDGSLKVFSQTSHWNGLSPVWTFSWLLKGPGVLNFLSQYLQEYFLLQSLVCSSKARTSEEMDFTVYTQKV